MERAVEASTSCATPYSDFYICNASFQGGHSMVCGQQINLYMNNSFSFNDIPQVLGNIVKRLEEIGKKVDQLQPVESTEKDAWFNIQELCSYLPSHPTSKTVYGWTSARIIPFHKNGKNISFLKSEIDLWLHDGKRKSHSEIAIEAEKYVNSKRKGV